MAVQQTTRTARVPAQSGPVEPPPAPSAPDAAVARPIGRDRPRNKEEQEFLLGAVLVFGGLTVLIVVFLLLAEYAW